MIALFFFSHSQQPIKGKRKNFLITLQPFYARVNGTALCTRALPGHEYVINSFPLREQQQRCSNVKRISKFSWKISYIYAPLTVETNWKQNNTYLENCTIIYNAIIQRQQTKERGEREGKGSHCYTSCRVRRNKFREINNPLLEIG